MVRVVILQQCHESGKTSFAQIYNVGGARVLVQLQLAI